MSNEVCRDCDGGVLGVDGLCLSHRGEVAKGLAAALARLMEAVDEGHTRGRDQCECDLCGALNEADRALDGVGLTQ